MKVGDYVRTKKGIKQIYKIDNNKTKWKYLFKLKEQDGDGCIDLGFLCDDDIIGEPSDKPIDLIEVGDYVNGNKVLEKEDYLLWLFDNDKHDTLYFNDGDIKSIVTKEQFESMEYKV